jgi:hypothetical protein
MRRRVLNTLAPLLARSKAIAAPIPRDAPVMIANLSLRGRYEESVVELDEDIMREL